MSLSHQKYRADIDGLRAIAVLSVVGFHAFPEIVKGGFVGVDVFFVISGFLISTIIFSSLEKGAFKFSEFYSRRICRIFPSLLTMLIACFSFGWFALLVDEYQQLGTHISAGAAFISNFVLWSESGYFDNVAETKPLLHLWSLGIEEQFYIAWPLLLWAAWKVQINLLALTLFMALGSFILNIKGINSDLVATFYSPQTRFWELLAGSTLGWLGLYKQASFSRLVLKIGRLGMTNGRLRLLSVNDGRFRNVRSIIGVALLLLAILVLSKDKNFPGWWALLPTLGTVLIISSGEEAWINKSVLSNRILVWFGLVSFPLYLWHWPLLSYLRIMEGGALTFEMRVAAVGCSIVLAWLSYRLVEKPLRFGLYRKEKVIVLILAMCFMAVLPFLVRGPSSYNNSELYQEKIYSKELQYKEKCVDSHAGLFFPDFNRDRDFCHYSIEPNNPYAYVIGDSHANRFYLGLLAEDSKNNYINMGRGTCLPFFEIDGHFENSEKPLDCQPTISNIINHAIESSAQKIYITGFFARYFDGRISSNRTDLLMAINNTFKKLNSSNKEIIFLIDVPTLPFDPAKCKVRPVQFTEKFDCSYEITKHNKIMGSYKNIIDDIGIMYPRIKIIDPTKVFCSEAVCSGRVGEIVAYKDPHHINSEGASSVARFVLRQINGE